MQPGLPIATVEGEHGAVRAIHQHGIGLPRALLAQRVAVMPDRTRVGSGVWGRDCGHTTTLRKAALGLVDQRAARLQGHVEADGRGGHA